MSWFTRLCRDVGLMVHNIKHPDDAPAKRVIRTDVEEKQVSPTVTLRRTTIEEIEVTKGEKP